MSLDRLEVLIILVLSLFTYILGAIIFMGLANVYYTRKSHRLAKRSEESVKQAVAEFMDKVNNRSA